jgi:hypothetical protein
MQPPGNAWKIACLLCAVWFGCQSRSDAPPVSPPSFSPVHLQTDAEKLLLVEQVPFGITYKDTKQLFPALREIHPEGHASQLGEQGLYEASMDMSIFGQQGRLEFNYDKDGLYSYYFWLTELNERKANVLNAELRAFYTKRFGKPRPLEQLPVKTVYWFQEAYRVLIQQFPRNDKTVLQWGFERRKSPMPSNPRGTG